MSKPNNKKQTKTPKDKSAPAKAVYKNNLTELLAKQRAALKVAESSLKKVVAKLSGKTTG